MKHFSNLILLNLTFIFSIVLLTQCKRDKDRTHCHCTQNYDSTVQYVKNDMVNYNGICWYSVYSGRGIIPGPWQQNGNDIWKECNGFIPN
jgi:hypothetical protein